MEANRMKDSARGATMVCASLAVALLVPMPGAGAAVPAQGDPVASRATGNPDLFVRGAHVPLADLPQALAQSLRADLSALGISAELGAYDLRAGRWGSLVSATPLVPGPGVGNTLSWAAIG